MTLETPTQPPVYRPTWSEVSVSAFLHNLRLLSDLLKPTTGLLAVVKADAYGHGAVPLARAAENSPAVHLWGFGVSSVEEGLVLRQSGIRRPILILGSLFPFEALEGALRHRLTLTVASQAGARQLAVLARRRRVKMAVHVKVDTGMGRIGVSPASAAGLLGLVAREKGLHLEGLYTHLANTGTLQGVRGPLTVFDRIVREARRRSRGLMVHAANSEALMRFPRAHYQLVRPGLALYGVPPATDLTLPLKPVLSWHTRAVFVKTVPRGTPVSYGGTWHAPRRSRLITLPVGYADGFRRSSSPQGQVLVRGRLCPVVGRVTMDQIIVDATAIPSVDVGEAVTLLGAQGEGCLTAWDVALAAGTIPYDIFCGLTSRVPRRVLP